MAAPVGELIRRLLPTGTLDLAFVAESTGHASPDAAAAPCGRGDYLRRTGRRRAPRIAEGYLRDTDMPLGQLASEFGYVEQSALTGPAGAGSVRPARLPRIGVVVLGETLARVRIG